MIISSWNIRGFNDPIKQQEVRGYLSRNKVEVFGLFETRVKQTNFATIIRTFPSYSVLNNYTHHYNGRIWVFLDTRRVTLISSSGHDQLIHLELLHHISNKTVHVSFVYGSNDATHRERLWHELRGLKPKVTNWILMGDWNIVRAMEERIGHNPPSITEILAFNQSLLDCQLEDLHSFGCECSALRDSDHSTLLVSIHDHYQQKRRFSYLNCWEDHKDYGKVVKEAWDIPVKGNAIHRLFPKLKNVRLQLINIHKTSYSRISGKVKEAQQHLHDCQISLQTKPLDSSLLALEQTLLQSYLDLKKAEKSSLTQRAKIQDIKYNYAPTSYYFTRIAARKHQSIIGKIKDRHGQDGFSAQFFKTSWNIIRHEFCNAVKGFLKTGNMPKQANTTLLALIPKKSVVSTVMDYRPIACCTVFYKTVSKILCSRLKPFLPDDLMLFVRGDASSVNVVTSSLAYFARLFGLHANPDKTNIYMGCIRKGIKQEILEATGYIEGEFPFRYLGVPLNEGKLNKTMFADLITKVQRALNHCSWTTWNYTYNIKSGDFWTLQKKSTHSESWRSILQVRDELLEMAGSGANVEALLHGCVKKGCIQLHLLSDQFRRKGSNISWGKSLWNRVVLPKHSVFLVLAIRQKLATIDQLHIRGIPLVNKCILCKADNETHKHLFFRYSFSGVVWQRILSWMRIHHRTSKLSKEVHWIAGRRVRKHRKAKWFSSCLGAAAYGIWEDRNIRIF
ncbi:uncharacterized protein LOC141651576 [Silene latifolia]|uniref:uncharacterized protein LOC141651576 n=1 Tax=Silene latifolia TaxID=37657 RepID=UPI003D781C7D